MREADYVNTTNARRVTGLSGATLSYHATSGHIRSIKKRNHKGALIRLYHIDDIRLFSWPGTTELARAAGVSRHLVLNRLRVIRVRGAVFHAGRWRFNPNDFPAICRWLQDGGPARAGFVPRGSLTYE